MTMRQIVALTIFAVIAIVYLNLAAKPLFTAKVEKVAEKDMVVEPMFAAENATTGEVIMLVYACGYNILFEVINRKTFESTQFQKFAIEEVEKVCK